MSSHDVTSTSISRASCTCISVCVWGGGGGGGGELYWQTTGQGDQCMNQEGVQQFPVFEQNLMVPVEDQDGIGCLGVILGVSVQAKQSSI